jgi:Fe-S cluster assembly scaffold protein SufB
MKYILNETPVKTTNGFKINNISVDLDIPTVYKLNIINITCEEMDKIDISIDKINKKECSKIGLEETLDYELNIIVKKYEVLKNDCIIEYHFTDDANKLFSKINIKAEDSSKSKFVIKFISDSDSYNFNYLKQINNIDDNAKLDVSIESNINEISDNLIAIENYVGENAYVNHNLYDLKGNKRISNYYTELAYTSSESSLNNIYIGKNDSLIDMNYLTNLIGAKTRTNMITYGILKDNAKKSYKSTIDFKSGCSKAYGKEFENVLLLDDTVISKSLPMLLCTEEDVEGSHSVSSGKVDANQLFYLMSRGLSKKEATKLIIFSKFNTLLNNETNKELKNEIINLIEKEI